MRNYLQIRPQVQGPVFVHFGGMHVTRYQFNAIFKKALSQANIPCNDYQTHSFRIGAASASSHLGIGDDEIKEFGRWSSTAYKSYIRIPTEKLAKVII